MQNNYKRSAEANARTSMSITVEGYHVALYFANEPNLQVAAQIRQALLGACFSAN